jgi:hypothetical protein
MASMPVAEPADQRPNAAELQRRAWPAVLRVFYEPRLAGPDLAGCALWLPLLLLAVSAALASYPLLFRLGAPALVDLKVHNTPEGLTRPAILVFLFLQFAAPLLIVIAAWLAGRIADAWLLFVLDAGAERRPVLRTTAYGMLPLAAGNVMAAAVRALAGPDSNPLNPLASNLAFFLNPAETAVFWYEFALGLDVFSVWAIFTAGFALAGLVRRKVGAVVPPLIGAWLGMLALRAWLLA